MNCLLVMKIKWNLDINTGAVERSEAARARRLASATVVGDDVIASTGYMKKQPKIGNRIGAITVSSLLPFSVASVQHSTWPSGKSRPPSA